MNKTTLTPYYYIAAILTGLVFVVAPALQTFAGHNGADVSHDTGECGETTFTASIADSEEGHKVDNMHLVVHDGDSTFSENIPTDGSDVEITVGPFEENTTIKWRVWGGGERDYDQPLWNGYGDPDFSDNINTYGDENGWDWVTGEPDDNPFVNWNEVEVDGCESPQKVNICHWAEGGHFNSLEVNENSITGPGQNNHSGHDFDIIPPFDGFGGHNWDDWENGAPTGFEGTDPQDVHENECAKSEPTGDGEISGEKYDWSSEEGLSGWTITVYNDEDEVATTTTTKEDGSYAFSGLSDGTYTVCEEDRDGWEQKQPTDGPECENETTGYEVVIESGSTESGINFSNEEQYAWCSFEGTVIDYTADQDAEQNDGDPVDPARRDISNVEDGPAPYANFGGSEANDWSTDDFFSLGIEGFLVYEFTNQVAFDQSGDDLAIYEITGGNTNTDEKVMVEVSQNGTDWVSLGTHAGDVALDISGTGLDYVKYVRLTDQSSGVQGNNGDGYDVDAIVILQGSCGNQPEEPNQCVANATANLNTEPSQDNVVNTLTEFEINGTTYNNGDDFDLFVSGDADASSGSVGDDNVRIERTTDGFELYFYGNGTSDVREFSGSFTLDNVDASGASISAGSEPLESSGAWPDVININTTTGEVTFTLYTNTANDSFVVSGLEKDCSEEPAPQCELNKELLENGDFENPTVTHNAQWNIFASGTSGLGWLVEWFGGNTTYNDATRPDLGHMELQKEGLQGWLASVGSQWTELDADWEGPDSSLNGEPGAVSISQTVGTEVGETYTFSFDFSPRPNTAADQNKVEVLANGSVIGTVGPDATASNQTEWSSHAFDFVATTTQTTFALRDAGTPNDSLGTFIDNASLMCTEPKEPKDTITVEKWNDEDGNSEWDEEEEGLSGWDMIVKPQSLEPVQTLEIDSSEHEGTSTDALSSGRVYLIEVEGTWENTGQSGREVDAEYFADDNWNTPQDMEDDQSRDPRQLDLVINNTNVDWGSYNDAHLYKTVVTGDGAGLDMRVFDEDGDNNKPSWYNDNTGSLTVRIYDVTDYVHTTGSEGSVEVEVTPGAYQIVEIQKEGWMQTAPQGPNYCHIDTREDESRVCSFGNKEIDDDTDDNGDSGGGGETEHTISGVKWNDVNQNGSFDDNESGISGWKIVVKPQSAEPVETLLVDSSNEQGATTTASLDSEKFYLIEAEGDYEFSSGRLADAEYYTEDNWSSESDWGSDNPNEDQRTLDLVVDNENIWWGAYNDDHLYKTVVSGADAQMNFRVFERQSSHYDDNQGEIEVRIYDVTDYVVITDEDGTYSTDVTPGEYQIVEVMQENWVQTAPSVSYCHFQTQEGQNTCAFGNYFVEPEPEPKTADLQIEKIVNTDTAGEGETVTYNISVTNHGPDDATGVVVEDLLPANVTWVSDTSGGDYSTTTGQWIIGSLADSNIPEILSITVEVNEETQDSNITNIATTTSEQEDPNEDNNVDSAMFTVEGVTNGGGSNGDDDEQEDEEDPQPQTQSTGGVGGGGIIGGPSAFGFQNPGSGGGQVLGATTEPDEQTQCVPEYLTRYLRLGDTGDQVTLLQAFLNGHINAGLTVNGTFGQQTHEAVEEFQSMYANEVLAPWGTNQPTGYVYYTTQKKINELACGDRKFPLTPAQLNEIERIRNQANRGQTSTGPIGGSSQQQNSEENTGLTQQDTQEDNSQEDDQIASVGEGAQQNGGMWGRIWNFFFGN